MTIRSYSDNHFYSKLEELAQLNSRKYYGHIVIEHGFQDLLLTENRFTADHPKKITSFIKTFFHENSFRLTAKHLPALDKIARFVASNGSKEISELYDSINSRYNQITFFPKELLLGITTTESLFLSLRAVNRAFYQNLPLSMTPRLSKALSGSVLEIQSLTNFLCKVVKKRQTALGRYILEQFLFKATEDAQYLFWSSFKVVNLKKLTSLLDTPFSLVTRLCFNVPVNLKTYDNFFTTCIYRCPNLEILRIHSKSKETLVPNILAAAINSSSLQVFDCRNFTIDSLSNLLTVFSASCKLQQIYLKAHYSPEIHEPIQRNGALFGGLFLEFQSSPKTTELAPLFAECPNLESFYLNHIALLPVIPNSIKELTIQLEGNDEDIQVISWLEKVNLPFLQTLEIKSRSLGPVSLKMVLESVKHFDSLTTLRCPLLVSENLILETKKLRSLCKKLEYLQLRMHIDTFISMQEYGINRGSRLKKLKFRVIVPEKNSIPFGRLGHIFHACNPRELFLALESNYGNLEADPSIATIRYVESNRLQFSFQNTSTPYLWPKNSRLQRVILKDYNLWTTSLEIFRSHFSIPNIDKQGVMLANIGFSTSLSD